MSTTFEVQFKMYGIATVKAGSEAEAVKYVASDLARWHGFGTDLEDVDVDGVDVSTES